MFMMIRSDLGSATVLVTARVVARDAEFGQRVIDQCRAHPQVRPKVADRITHQSDRATPSWWRGRISA